MNQISSLLKFLANKSVLETAEHTTTEATQASATQTSRSQTFAKSGYYPIGIVGLRLEGTGVGQLVPYAYRLSSASNGSATVNYGIRNNNPTTDITFTVKFSILWQKIGGVLHKALNSLKLHAVEAHRGGTAYEYTEQLTLLYRKQARKNTRRGYKWTRCCTGHVFRHISVIPKIIQCKTKSNCLFKQHIIKRDDRACNYITDKHNKYRLHSANIQRRYGNENAGGSLDRNTVTAERRCAV